MNVTTPASERQLGLGIMIGDSGFHQAAWRLPGSRIEEISSLQLFADLAREAEDSGVDFLFVADPLGFRASSLSSWPTNQLEPLTLLSALAAVTSRIGLIGTASTTFTEPYNLARQFLSLDRISNGRAGWNIVTSTAGEQHFGRDFPGHAERYARAADFVNVVNKLWDSFPQEAIIADAAQGIYGRPELVDEEVHHGDFFSIQGPLGIPQSVQGRPVLVQAGSSEAGKAFGAKVADLVFTMQPNLDDAAEFASDLEAKVLLSGRRRESVQLFHGISPIIASTEQEARSLARDLVELTDLDTGLAALQRHLYGADLSGLALDEPLPESLLAELPPMERGQSAYVVIRKRALEERATLRELIFEVAMARGHWIPVGTPEQLAQQMQHRFERGLADGFLLLPCDIPSQRIFLQEVIPLLTSRGIFAPGYPHRTLRQNLGLPSHRPSHCTKENIQ